MDYYETRRSLIQYLNIMISRDRWRIRYGIPTVVVASDLYKILLDVLSEHVNVRYGNLVDANERDIYSISDDKKIEPFNDEKALHYIRIVYFLYTQLSNSFVPLWQIMEKICDIIREGKYDEKR